jgi:hypothetical protein
MHFPTLLTTALISTAIAAPTTITTRQNRPTKPTPCQRADPEPEGAEVAERFEAFAQAFIYTKNITEAFSYITQDYIVCYIFSSRTLFHSTHPRPLRIPTRQTPNAPHVIKESQSPTYHSFSGKLKCTPTNPFEEPQPRRPKRIRFGLEHSQPHLGQPKHHALAQNVQ